MQQGFSCECECECECARSPVLRVLSLSGGRVAGGGGLLSVGLCQVVFDHTAAAWLQGSRAVLCVESTSALLSHSPQPPETKEVCHVKLSHHTHTHAHTPAH